VVEKFFRIQRRHAAGSRRGHRLAIDVVRDVAGREHAGYAGRGGIAVQAALHADVAVGHFQLSGEDFGVGRVADGDEHARDLQILRPPGNQVVHADAGDAAGIAQHLVQTVVPQQPDVSGSGALEEFLLHDLLGAQLVAAVHQRDFGAQVGQIERLFHGGVAAADHGDLAVAIEESVTGGAGADAPALERLLGGQSEIARRRPGGDDQGIAAVVVATLQPEWPAAQIHRLDMVYNCFYIKAFGMLLHPLHEIRSLDAVRVSGPVVHLGGGGELPALLNAGDHRGRQVGTCGIDGGGPAGRAGAEDDEAVMVDCWHGNASVA
jgi:hypothetical protein